MQLSNKTLVVGAAVALAALAGVFVYRAWPATVPEIVLQDAEGQAVGLDRMRQGKNHLIAVFLMPGCPVSKFSLGILKEQHGRWSDRAAFVGWFFGLRAAAADYQEQNEVPFDVYGLQEATDPFAANELIQAVGSSEGLRSAVWGGTVIVIDRDRKVVLKLEKEDVRELPERLADLLD